jgi:hypothetical protein
VRFIFCGGAQAENRFVTFFVCLDRSYFFLKRLSAWPLRSSSSMKLKSAKFRKQMPVDQQLPAFLEDIPLYLATKIFRQDF